VKHLKLKMKRAFFKVLTTSRAAQAAVMVLGPGESTGAPDNEHPHSEQWLFVVSGSGRALVEKRRVALGAESLLLIEKGETHQVVNSGRMPLVTVNFYVPPAYRSDGTVRPSAH
jgi:mannose-6-phosphate isomerase-like protein (cupin superfamily)